MVSYVGVVVVGAVVHVCRGRAAPPMEVPVPPLQT